MSGRITVNGDLPRRTVLFDRLSEELFGGSDVAVFAEEEINSESLFIYCTVEIRPSPSDFDIRLIDTPRSADRTSVAQPAFLELWNEAVNVRALRPRVREMLASLCPTSRHFVASGRDIHQSQRPVDLPVPSR